MYYYASDIINTAFLSVFLTGVPQHPARNGHPTRQKEAGLKPGPTKQRNDVTTHKTLDDVTIQKSLPYTFHLGDDSA